VGFDLGYLDTHILSFKLGLLLFVEGFSGGPKRLRYQEIARRKSLTPPTSGVLNCISHRS
jgi:hypothetical protein